MKLAVDTSQAVERAYSNTPPVSKPATNILVPSDLNDTPTGVVSAPVVSNSSPRNSAAPMANCAERASVCGPEPLIWTVTSLRFSGRSGARPRLHTTFSSTKIGSVAVRLSFRG